MNQNDAINKAWHVAIAISKVLTTVASLAGGLALSSTLAMLLMAIAKATNNAWLFLAIWAVIFGALAAIWIRLPWRLRTLFALMLISAALFTAPEIACNETISSSSNCLQ